MQSNLVYYIDAIREKNQEMTELKQEIDSLKASQVKGYILSALSQ